MSDQTLQRTLEAYREIVDSPRNRQAATLWQGAPGVVYDFTKFRSHPRPLCDIGGRPPIVSCLDGVTYGELLGFTLNEFYDTPETYLLNLLRARIYYYNLVEDDTYFEPLIPLWFGLGHEATFFGLQLIYGADAEPWVELRRVIEGPDDLAKLSFPDFKSSGVMPKALRFYETISRLVEPYAMTVAFLDWIRAPLGMSIYLRGLDSITVDMVERPSFARAIFDFIVESHARWCEQRAEYLGEPTPKVVIDNDEVNVDRKSVV